MTRKIIVGGFASEQRQMDRVARSFSEFYDEDVEGVSFRSAMNNPLALDELVRGGTVFTHSAGMVAIKDTMPREIIAVAPPVPTSVTRLIARSARGAHDLARESFSQPLKQQLTLAGRGAELGLEVFWHPRAHLGRLGVISTFDAIERGIAAQSAGIETDIAFMDHDQLFQLSNGNRIRAANAGLSVLTLHGGHEKLLFEPDELIAEYDDLKQAPQAA